jgi:phosphoglycolate phosphatase-like HAD superfamily hydrolase
VTKVIVFDIDGTLANIEHRRSYVATKPKNWKAFNAGIPNDTPHEDIVWLAKTFAAQNHIIVLCSGRGKEQHDATVKQMEDFGVFFNALFMRPFGDHRQDSIVKVELLQQIRAVFGEPFLWFDDRTQVVNAIRAEGVRVLQVAPGDF